MIKCNCGFEASSLKKMESHFRTNWEFISNKVVKNGHTAKGVNE